MTCKFCDHLCQRAGKQRNGAQKLYCTRCDKYQQQGYIYLACRAGAIEMVQSLTCESVGIRGISRVPGIAANTVMERTRSMASTIERPIVGKDQPCFEVDELWTYIGRKANEHWVAYALDQKKDVIDFVVGKRTVSTLRELIIPLLSSGVKKIKTDRLTYYWRLIPKERHYRSAHGINHIERENLTLRTHLKRLSRRTICFSRKLAMLENCLRIYFWRSSLKLLLKKL